MTETNKPRIFMAKGFWMISNPQEFCSPEENERWHMAGAFCSKVNTTIRRERRLLPRSWDGVDRRKEKR